jgi:phage shock protein A
MAGVNLFSLYADLQLDDTAFIRGLKDAEKLFNNLLTPAEKFDNELSSLQTSYEAQVSAIQAMKSRLGDLSGEIYKTQGLYDRYNPAVPRQTS